MTEERIMQIALEAYPIRKYWIGAGETSRLFDENEFPRNRYIEGFKKALELQSKKP
jgi:hypothetical protein